jgi:hypothetical protein
MCLRNAGIHRQIQHDTRLVNHASQWPIWSLFYLTSTVSCVIQNHRLYKTNTHTHFPNPYRVPKLQHSKVLLHLAPNNITSKVLRCSAMWFEHSLTIYFQCINTFLTFKCVSLCVTDRDSNHIPGE